MRFKARILMIFSLSILLIILASQYTISSTFNFSKNYEGSAESLLHLEISPIEKTYYTGFSYTLDVELEIIEFPVTLLNYSYLYFQLRVIDSQGEPVVRSNPLNFTVLDRNTCSIISNVIFIVPSAESLNLSSNRKLSGKMQFYLEAREYLSNNSFYNIQITWNNGFIADLNICQPHSFDYYFRTLFVLLISACIIVIGVKSQSEFKMFLTSYWKHLVIILCVLGLVVSINLSLPRIITFLSPSSEFTPVSQSPVNFQGTLDISINLTVSNTGYHFIWNNPIAYLPKPEPGSASVIGYFGPLPNLQAAWGEENIITSLSSGIEIITRIKGIQLTPEAYPFDKFSLEVIFEADDVFFFNRSIFNVDFSLFNTILDLIEDPNYKISNDTQSSFLTIELIFFHSQFEQISSLLIFVFALFFSFVVMYLPYSPKEKMQSSFGFIITLLLITGTLGFISVRFSLLGLYQIFFIFLLCFLLFFAYLFEKYKEDQNISRILSFWQFLLYTAALYGLLLWNEGLADLTLDWNITQTLIGSLWAGLPRIIWIMSLFAELKLEFVSLLININKRIKSFILSRLGCWILKEGTKGILRKS